MEMSKEQFFALYYLQPVQMSTKHPGEHFLCKPDYNGKEWYLSLRSIARLTEWEVIIIHYILNPDSQIGIKTNAALLEMHTKAIKRLLIEDRAFYNRPVSISVKLITYLISIGILLDNSAIEKGWCVIREDGA